jgi:hypothetical protein
MKSGFRLCAIIHYGLTNLLHPLDKRALLVIHARMLPNPPNRDPLASKDSVDAPVSPTVSFNFCGPICSVPAWKPAMCLATMEEAAIRKQG